jgi:hypothetical protein
MSPLSRILLFMSIAVVVVVAGLWISGGKKEEYSAKIEISAKPSQIFPYFIEPEKIKGWMSGLEEIDVPVPPKEDYASPPELIRTVVDPDGKRIRYNDLVIRYSQNEILTVQSSATGTTQTSILQLEPIDSKTTKFSYFVKVTHNGVSRLIAPLQTSKLQDRVNADVQKLKGLVEKNEPELPDEPETTQQPEQSGSDAEKKAPSNSVPDVSGEG